MSTDLMRNLVAYFLLTDTDPSDVWSRIGDGITTGAISANPEITTEAYIHQSSGTSTLERYTPNLPVSGKCKKGDAVFDYVRNLWKTRAVGSAAETYILEVDLDETPVATDQYPARKQKVIVAIDNPPGGDGGTVATISYTLHYAGDAVAGLWDVSSASFATS